MTEPYYQDERVTLYHGTCLDVLASLPNESIDAVCTDPPYGLSNTDPQHVADTIVRWVNGDREYLPPVKGGFMGQEWDSFVPPVAVWDECLRVLKPGGHLLAFAGPRTMDLMGLGIRLAGFDIRDSIAWLYGSGFPKSLDVSKAIDKARDDRDDVLQVTSTLADLAAAAGITRADIDAHMGTSDMGGWWLSNLRHRCACPSVENWTRLRDFIPGAHALDDLVWKLNGRKGTWGNEREDRKVGGPDENRVFQPTQRVEFAGTPATDAAERWQGWGTALKPSHEPVVCARKPLAGTVASNVLTHGTGALNIDGCRIETTDSLGGGANVAMTRETRAEGWGRPWMEDDDAREQAAERSRNNTARAESLGRWPANVVLDDSQAAALDRQSGESRSPKPYVTGGTFKDDGEIYGKGIGNVPRHDNEYADTGGASRFFKVISQTPDFPTFRGGPQCMLWVCGSMSANTAEIPSSTSLAQPAATAPERATTSNDASTVRAAASAVGLCVSCGTAIAQSLAPPAPAPTPQTLGLPSTGDSSEQILTRSLALIAADLASSGTTLTTPNWTTLLGCAADAINAYTTRASRLAVRRSAPSDPSSDFPRWKYEAKAPATERPRVNGVAHPTVKPLSLMSWLVRLVTPPGGTVLEPFAGSGTTVEACIIEGFRCIAIEREADYLPLITQRIHRRLDPLEAVRQTGGDLGLFDFGDAS